MSQCTTTLAFQLRAMSNFASVRSAAAFGSAWSAVNTTVLNPNGINAGVFGNPPSSADDHAQLMRFRKRVIQKVRPELNRQAMRFVKESPVGHAEFTLHGFDSLPQAIRLAKIACDHGVLSSKPADILIASALALIKSERTSICEFDLYPDIRAKRIRGGELLDRDEKIFLLELAKTGDTRAIDHLIFFYRPLITGVAYRVWRLRTQFGRTRLSIDELIQFSRFRFSYLVKKYESSLGSFETYIKNWLPLLLQKVLIRDSDDVSRAREVSLNAPLRDDDDRTYEDLIADTNFVHPDDECLGVETRKKLFWAMIASGLKEQERIVLLKCGLEERTHDEVGEMLGVTRQRVGKVHGRAFEKISNGPYAEELRALL